MSDSERMSQKEKTAPGSTGSGTSILISNEKPLKPKVQILVVDKAGTTPSLKFPKEPVPIKIYKATVRRAHGHIVRL